jgi:hypothetical protein
MRHIEPEAAIQAYERFLEKHAQSTYYDDAVADLEGLRLEIPPALPSSDHAPVVVPRVAPEMVALRQDLWRLRQNMRFHGSGTSVAPFAHTVAPDMQVSIEHLDGDTRVRINALYAIGEGKEDDKSFTTLKTVALDGMNRKELRLAAMDVLSNYRKFDPLPVFAEIVRKDTSELLQHNAIAYIGESRADKNKSISVLIDLFNSLPHERVDQMNSLFFFIADVGNEKAVDFLAKVAKSHKNDELRNEAVFYLGNIGSERARSVLYEILSGRK